MSTFFSRCIAVLIIPCLVAEPTLDAWALNARTPSPISSSTAYAEVYTQTAVNTPLLSFPHRSSVSSSLKRRFVTLFRSAWNQGGPATAGLLTTSFGFLHATSHPSLWWVVILGGSLLPINHPDKSSDRRNLHMVLTGAVLFLVQVSPPNPVALPLALVAAVTAWLGTRFALRPSPSSSARRFLEIASLPVIFFSTMGVGLFGPSVFLNILSHAVTGLWFGFGFWMAAQVWSLLEFKRHDPVSVVLNDPIMRREMFNQLENAAIYRSGDALAFAPTVEREGVKASPWKIEFGPGEEGKLINGNMYPLRAMTGKSFEQGVHLSEVMIELPNGTIKLTDFFAQSFKSLHLGDESIPTGGRIVRLFSGLLLHRPNEHRVAIEAEPNEKVILNYMTHSDGNLQATLPEVNQLLKNPGLSQIIFANQHGLWKGRIYTLKPNVEVPEDVMDLLYKAVGVHAQNADPRQKTTVYQKAADDLVQEYFDTRDFDFRPGSAYSPTSPHLLHSA